MRLLLANVRHLAKAAFGTLPSLLEPCMGNVSYEDGLDAAERHAKALAKQEEVRSDAGDARMLDRRRTFLLAAERMFFESILDDSDLMPMRYLTLGQLAARPVGRIQVQMPDGHGSGFATGFLVAPNLLLTNQHVLPDFERAQAASLTLDAEDDVNGVPKPPRVFLLDPGRLFVTDVELDFCFVAVTPRAVDRTPLAGYGYLRLLEDTGKISRSEYATIIQHPNGRQKHLASRNNRITVYVYDDDLAPEARATNNFLYYSTDTLKGSSGSPVFSDQWFVVALHRRGVPETKVVNGRTVIMRTNGQPAAADDPEEVIKYTSNEGVRISRVVQRLATVAETPADQRQPMAQQALDMVREAAGRIHDGPFSIPTAPLALLLEAPGQLQAQSSEEIVHRNTGAFPDNLGYQENFLAGHPLPLPVPSVALRKELAPRIDKPQEFLLPFRHFTTVMHARRRLPVFAAVNISGAQKPEGGMGARPQWSYDPRIDEVHQPDDTIFSDMLQRGHMAARDYVVWGAADELRQADLHSFTLTNVCPQVREFNAHREWYEVERQVATGAEEEGRRITEFVGPILRSTDPSYDDLRGTRSRATRGTGIRVPLRFWKIVVWVEEGALQHRAFILDQEAELTAAEPLEFDVTAPAGVTATTVQEIEALTDLRFQGL